jgi:hypothetical protein
MKNEIMGRCESCGEVLSSNEMFRSVEVEDGGTIEIMDNICNVCLGKYVYGVDALDHHFYACSDLTDALFDTYLGLDEESS